jgi:nicotinamidase/pyrazinamidase
MTRALIIADPQRDFCEGGSLGVGGGAAAVSRIDRLLKSDHGYAQVIANCDHHIDPGGDFAAEPDFVDSWPPHCVVGSAGR